MIRWHSTGRPSRVARCAVGHLFGHHAVLCSGVRSPWPLLPQQPAPALPVAGEAISSGAAHYRVSAATTQPMQAGDGPDPSREPPFFASRLMRWWRCRRVNASNGPMPWRPPACTRRGEPVLAVGAGREHSGGASLVPRGLRRWSGHDPATRRQMKEQAGPGRSARLSGSLPQTDEPGSRRAAAHPERAVSGSM